ncbi:MAG: prephenate/arogenate dehydrogenase [Microcoleaceae cyanobacterium]
MKELTIGIIGLGLIGGSLGLDLQSSKHPENNLVSLTSDEVIEALSIQKILGVSRRQSTCEQAIIRGVVDEASTDLSLMKTADVIFICTPIALIVPTIEQLIPHLKQGAILTDVGSVKQPIVELASILWPNFVGGHPMAGTEQTGIEAAQHHLFINRPYVIAPTAKTPEKSIQIVSILAQFLGSKVYLCQPQEHDQAVAWISHAPVMISASSLACLEQETASNVMQLATQLASSGFRDTSRVGGGNPELGVMMAQYNQPAILRSLLAYRQSLDQMIDLIEQENWIDLHEQLTQTQQTRNKFKF